MTDSTLNRFLGSGTTTQRTAFTPSPPTPASGPSPQYLWWDTTLQELFAWNAGSSAWVVIGAGAATVIDMAVPQFNMNTGNSTATGFFLGRMIVSDQAATMNSIKFWATSASASPVVYPAVYSVTNAGVLGTLLASGSSTTGVTQGLNKLDFTSGLAVTRGQGLCIGFVVQTAAISMATLGSSNPSANTTYFSTGGAPPSTPGSTTYGGTQGYVSMWISSDS
jgi:hypothetical protein